MWNLDLDNGFDPTHCRRVLVSHCAGVNPESCPTSAKLSERPLDPGSSVGPAASILHPGPSLGFLDLVPV